MSEDGSDISSRIVIGETDRVTELLICTPVLSPNSTELHRTVDFGNTGFNIHFDRLGESITTTFNFMPEGWFAPNKENSAKYAIMLGASLLEVYKFANDPNKLLEFGIDGERITQLEAITNKKLIDSLVTLFSRNGNEDIVNLKDRRVGEEKVVSIDWQKFRNLKSSDRLIQYLSKISDRGKKSTVTYDKFIK